MTEAGPAYAGGLSCSLHSTLGVTRAVRVVRVNRQLHPPFYGFNSWTLFPVLLGPLGPGVTFAWHSFQGTCLCTLRCASCYRRFFPLLVFLFPHPLPTMPWCLILYDKTGSCFNGLRQESRDQERYRVAGSSHKSLVTRWSSPVTRQAHNLKVVSSNLAPATNF